MGHTDHLRNQFKSVISFEQLKLCYAWLSHNFDKEEKQEAHGPHPSAEKTV